MKTYAIKMKSNSSREHRIRRKDFISFSEAASWAFLERIKMGEGWSIISVGEELSCAS